MDIFTDSHSDGTRFTLKGVMSFRDRDAFSVILDAVNQRAGAKVTVDLTALEHVDSFGIGLFLLANEQAVGVGSSLHLLNPQGDVSRIFDLANLDAILSLKQTMPATGATARNSAPPRRIGIDYRHLGKAEDGSPCVGFSGRLVFAEHGHFQEIVENLIANGGPRVVLDLSELEFMDSAGLSMIMIAHEEAEAKQIALVLRNPKGAVAQLLSLSALEFMLEA
ncbi:STAS domain-containing protein [Magnetospirillum sulfuroxidans]|uniref:STAS domain-containing protein n=1 Tax=Magnetospirillum sulfuroxidans TaxID=611300 RepID=A0ABS5I8F6_9PROT|nr:STAS domain-containing protein [Magnetospirillum sulfuroxidans]MBR9970720.1 STAS domain-containing protein [Magnetospirillum sulfuroxidans]